MANKDDYLTSYREFFENFAQTVNPNDQLPVKLASYKLLNVEVVGGIIDWTTQYLTQKKCPPHLFAPLIKIIIEEIRKSCKKQPLNYGFNSTDNAYEPLKLMQAVMAQTNEICLRYLDNSVLCSLPSPSNTYYETSIFAARNRRRKMEDRHVAIHDLNTMFNIQEASPSSYYAIFDGHAGHDAAAYSSAHLHQFLAENKYFISNPEQALLDAFCKTDALFLEKCKVENLSGGTTAVVALLRPKEKTLYIAWVGDSQALLVKQGTILQCVNPHKPSREDERERIEKTGGCVMLWGTWRVNGQLAVSRAIGDADYKPCVIAIPDVKEISLDGHEDFLIIACDGLWDSLSEDAAAQEVYYMVAENPDDTERISKRLVHLARYQGSTDNISVIVVFLREPHKIAAEAHRWATRNGPPLPTDNMEAGLDNANNPFTNSNGSLKNLDVETDNIHLQKSGDGLLLNLTDNFKANGTDLSQDIFEKSNGTKKSASDIHFDDEFGPETDVDAVDDAFSPVEKTKAFLEDLTKGYNDESLPKSFNDEVKAFSEGIANNNPLDDAFNPFSNKEVEDIDKEINTVKDFEEHGGDNREETPTPPVDAVHDVGGLEENPAESDSEDEWNYFKGDQAKPETLSSQPETVVETSELEDAMSQLNPNAAEFVPVSPTRSIPSPACRALLNDEVISQSPKRPVAVDIKVPNETEFESEVKSRPSDFNDYSNGHDSDSEHNISGSEQFENLLNGKSLEDIPDFQPGSTPAKQSLADEFHFGPNAARFTPKALDQSEAFSTKANYGDDTEQTLNASFNDSELAIPVKDFGDPMSMSFSAERGELNPFQDNDDLNKVHDLPEDLDEFLGKSEGEGSINDDKENRILDDTISDLPEHDVLGAQLMDNDRAAIQTTDLDKLSQDDEKELASPLEPDQEDFMEKPKTQETNLLEGFVVVPEKITTDDSNVSSLPELEPIPVEHGVSPVPELEKLIDVNVDVHQEKEHEGLGGLESQSPVCEFTSKTKTPFDDFEGLKPTSDICETAFDPKSEVENISFGAKSPNFFNEPAKSPVLACEYSAEVHPQSSGAIPESHSPLDFQQEEKHEEDITSSIKDDISSPMEPMSPVKSPDPKVVESLIEDHFKHSEWESESKQEEIQECPIQKAESLVQQEVLTTTEVPAQEASNQDSFCPMPLSQFPNEPLVQTNEINLLEASAPMEPSKFEELSNGLAAFTTQMQEQFSIRTDSIKPEFAEPAVITPSEDSKVIDEAPAILQPDAPVQEPPKPELEMPERTESSQEVPKDLPVLSSPLPVAPVETKEVKKDEKKSSTAASAKKPIGKTGPSKLSTPPKTSTTKMSPKPASTSSKTGVSPRVPSKTGPIKAPTTTTSRTSATAATKPSPKPKTAAAPKPIEKKPLTNGDVKPAPRTTLTKRPAAEPTATKTTTRPATAASKTSPTKTTAPRPATAPRTAPLKTSTTAPRPAPSSTTTAKPRVPLSSRTAGTVSGTSTTTKTTTTTARTSLSPRAPAPPKPRTITSTAPKPRPPITKTITKSADLEKEKKESANKLTASRTTTVTKSTSATATSRTATTTVRKTETKPLSQRSAMSKTTTTTTKTSSMKKPGEIKSVTKTKTTKIEKPKENGIAAANITEEIKELTIVNNVVNTETENLLKDNSPLDNKLITETTNSLID